MATTRAQTSAKLCRLSEMENEIRSIELWRCVISECLATFLFVLLSCASVLRWDTSAYAATSSSADVILISFTFGFGACALTQCFGHISGAHFNPAVTLAMAVTCRVTPLRATLYVGAQCGGGIAGAALLYGLTPPTVRGHLGGTLMNPELNVAQGFAVEFFLTFLLTFTFFATVDPKRRNHGNQAVPIGATVTFIHLVGYRLTGCSCNPARSLGPAFLTNVWDNHWIYWTGPVGGSILAGVLYHFIFDPSKHRTKVTQLSGSRSASVNEIANKVSVSSFKDGPSPCYNTYKRHSALFNSYHTNVRNHACENTAYDYNSTLRRNSGLHVQTYTLPRPPSVMEQPEMPMNQSVYHRKY